MDRVAPVCQIVEVILALSMHRAAQLVARGVSTTTRHALARALEHAELVKGRRSVDEMQVVWRQMMRIFARQGMVSEALALLDDMKACHVHPQIDMLDMALEAAVQSDYAARIQDVLSYYAPEPMHPLTILSGRHVANWTPTTYTHLLHHCARTSNFEYMILLVNTARKRAVVLGEDALLHIVRCAHQAGEPRIAYDMTRNLFNNASARIWMNVLRTCAVHMYAPGIQTAWEHSRPLETDEGLLIAILHAASRHGYTELVSSALACVPELTDVHLIPAWEAFCEARQFDRAMDVLGELHACGAETPPMARLMRKAAESIDALKCASAALLRAPRSVPSEAWSAVMYAAAELQHMPTARILGYAAPQPTSGIIQAWLQCCLDTKDRAEAERAWSFMHEQGITPTATCFERMVRMHLMQEQYEQAFALLEQTKQCALVPTRRMYAAMIWTCWQHNDERWRDLMQEMQEARYEPGERLRALS